MPETFSHARSPHLAVSRYSGPVRKLLIPTLVAACLFATACSGGETTADSAVETPNPEPTTTTTTVLVNNDHEHEDGIIHDDEGGHIRVETTAAPTSTPEWLDIYNELVESHHAVREQLLEQGQVFDTSDQDRLYEEMNDRLVRLDNATQACLRSTVCTDEAINYNVLPKAESLYEQGQNYLRDCRSSRQC